LGSGTTMKVARRLGMSCIGIEINPKYVEMAKKEVKWNEGFIEFSFEEVK
ncbi:MAG: DNA methyltransferase, partial [Candidatus Methanospirareceae archaeon]